MLHAAQNGEVFRILGYNCACGGVGCQRLLLHVVKCMEISRTSISGDLEETGDVDVVRRLMSGGFGMLGRLIVEVRIWGKLLGLSSLEMAAMLEELMSTEGERKKVLFQGRGRAIGGSDLASSSGVVTGY